MSRMGFFLSSVKGKTLDVGFNVGPLHEKIREKLGGENVFGVDLTVEKEDAHYKKAKAEALPFADASFDTVVAGELVEHLEEPKIFFEEAKRVLRENGALVVSTPNRKSLVNRLFKSYETTVHLNLFDEKDLERIMEKNGFAVEKKAFFPYAEESSSGSKMKWLFALRGALDFLLPNGLKEQMCFAAKKKGEGA
ncbi:MAG: class I SAM-dependent methyltransferase [Candidatus Diapherotrites archaeon]